MCQVCGEKERDGLLTNVIKLRILTNMKKHPPRFEWGGCFLTR